MLYNMKVCPEDRQIVKIMEKSLQDLCAEGYN